MEYFEKHWDLILNVETKMMMIIPFLSNMNRLLDKHFPFKKLSKYQLELKTKPWITAALRQSVLVKNSLFKGTVVQREKALIYGRLRVSKVYRKFHIPTIYNSTETYPWILSFS